MQHQRQERRVEFAIVDRQRFELAFSNIDVAELTKSLACGIEHLGGTVDGDDTAHIRRHGFGELAGAAAEVADGQRGIDQAEHRPKVKGVAEQILAQPVPFAGCGGKELARLHAPPFEHATQTALVVRGRRRRGHLLPDQRP
jgi:hypothetical protein